MNSIKKRLTRLAQNLQNQWSDGQYVRTILNVLGCSILIALAVILICKGISALVAFLRRNYAQLIIAALVLWAFAGWRDKHKADRLKLQREEQEIRERQNYSDRLEAAQTKEATYNTQAKVLFEVSRELGPLGIVPPARLSDLYSPGRTIPKANGTVNISLYLLQKDRETVDTDLLKHTLQTKIDQRLQTGEFPGIPEQHFYRGRVYSGFVIDMVRDSTGGFVEVYTALVDDNYCRYRERRNLNSSILLPSVDRQDPDY